MHFNNVYYALMITIFCCWLQLRSGDFYWYHQNYYGDFWWSSANAE